MKNISVVGAGTMGNGIAQVFAQNHFQVTLVDVSQVALDKALLTIEKNLDRMIQKGSVAAEEKPLILKNITPSSNIENGVKNADLIVEAASESEALKFNIFTQLDRFSPKHCILASNTSSISITKIGAQTLRPEKVIGMHFMNPVPIMKLVEVINGYATSPSTTNAIISLSKQLNKIPLIANDYPGFVANRILMPMINEAIITLQEGIAGVYEIDNIMKLGMAHPMGPLQLADFIGLDVCKAIMEVLHQGLGNPKYAPCPLLNNMVAAKNLGVKTGVGFYSYSSGSKEITVADKFKS